MSALPPGAFRRQGGPVRGTQRRQRLTQLAMADVMERQLLHRD